MTKIHLYSLASPLHSEVIPSPADDRFIKDILSCGGVEFIFHNDFSTWGTFPSGREVLYIRTGGTEGLFLQTFFGDGSVIPSEARESPSSVISTERQRAEKSHFTLLTSGESNSLAASMEILSFLRLRGLSGEIIHGTPASVAARLAALPSSASVISSEVEKSLPVEGAERLLEGVRLGVVGRPSDWLISSEVDYAKARERFGVEIIDISMDELLDEIRVGGFSIPDAIRLNSLNTPKYGVPFKAGDFDKALEIYGALSRIVRKYSLQGLTLRCFDLLGTVGSTGCMALAILNAEGITATCEGDVPAMVTMAIAKKIAGTPGFQVNLSRIREEGFLFAHCTVPLNIVDNYCYDTHFESGIGVAVHGEFSKGPVTLFKVGASMDRFFLAPAILVDNPYANNLCRTQVLLRPAAPAEPSPSHLAPAAEASVSAVGSAVADASASVAGVVALADYFLREPLGNHHVILPGDWVSAIRKNLAWRP
ncbi:MAG: hypothetical protein IKP46_06910 [Bacteroidales bacterium]|nr:hypothetical protein [Bacteroidales bacterium]